MPKTTYHPKEKIAAVEEYLSSGLGVYAFATRRGIPQCTFRDWVRIYRSLGPEGFQYRQNHSRTVEEKLLAVHFYLEGKGTQLETCEKFRISSATTLRYWIRQYNNHELKLPRKRRPSTVTGGRKTTLKERIAIVEEYLATDTDYRKLAKKYQVSNQQVYQWVRKFKDGGIEALEDRRGKRRSPSQMTEEEKLRAENRLLKAQMYRQQVEIDFLKKLKEIEGR